MKKLNVLELALDGFDQQTNWYTAQQDQQFQARKNTLRTIFEPHLPDSKNLEWFSVLQEKTRDGEIIDTPNIFDAMVNILTIVSEGDEKTCKRFKQKWRRLEEGLDKTKSQLHEKTVHERKIRHEKLLEFCNEKPCDFVKIKYAKLDIGEERPPLFYYAKNLN